MGWYFLSEYQDFYRPGDPYGIVEWYASCKLLPSFYMYE